MTMKALNPQCNMPVLWDIHCSIRILVYKPLCRWMSMLILLFILNITAQLHYSCIEYHCAITLFNRKHVQDCCQVCVHGYMHECRVWNSKSQRWAKWILTFERAGFREICKLMSSNFSVAKSSQYIHLVVYIAVCRALYMDSCNTYEMLQIPYACTEG